MNDAPHNRRDISPLHVSLRAVTKDLVSLLISGTTLDPTTTTQAGKTPRGLPWRVLITDDRGSKLVNALFTKAELRAQGITLSMSLDSEREQLEDVGAVYLLNVNTHNIGRCAKDILAKKYAEFRMCFLSLSPIALMEELARSVAGAESVANVFINDCPLRFSVFADNLYALNSPAGFQLLGAENVKESSLVATTSDHIQDILRVLDATPSVAYMPGSFTARLAQEVSKRCQSAQKPLGSPRKREVLVLIDRSYDISTALSVPFTYGDLVMDCFPVDSNKIRITEKQLAEVAPGDQTEVTNCLTKAGNSHFLDLNGDALWEDYQGLYFGAVCERIERDLADFQRDKQKATASPDEFATMMAAAPELLERKLSIDKNTLLSKILLHEIKRRGLDAYHDLCEGIICATRSRRRVDCIDEISFRVTSPSALGDWSDRIRVLCLFTLYTHAVDGRNARFVASLESKLNELFPDDAPKTSRILQAVHRLARESPGGEGSGQSTPWQWFDKKITSAAQAITSSFKSTGDDALLPITEVLAALFSRRPNVTALSTRMTSMALTSVEDINARKRILESVRFIEPPVGRGMEAESETTGKTTCIVCILGGFTFREYRDALEWSRRRENAGTQIIFGGSNVIQGSKLLESLADSV